MNRTIEMLFTVTRDRSCQNGDYNPKAILLFFCTTGIYAHRTTLPSVSQLKGNIYSLLWIWRVANPESLFHQSDYRSTFSLL